MLQQQNQASIFDIRLRLRTVVSLIVLATMLAIVTNAKAQTFTVLHYFTGGPDGAFPEAGVTIGPSGAVYGTAGSGGTTGSGTVFKLSQVNSAWVFTPLYEFTGKSDGAYPIGGVVFGPDGALYGTTQQGGYENNGTVFVLRPPSTICRSITCYWNETVLHTFTGVPDGINPWVENLIFDAAGNIYGTTGNGGTYDNGTAFELTPSGGGQYTENILHSFGKDQDGAYPDAGMVFDSSGNLYGTTGTGGTGRGCDYGCGTAYQLVPSAQGWAENVLVNFDLGSAGLAGAYFPYSPLVIDGSGNLYGTTIYSTSVYLDGIVFKLAPSGGGFMPSVFYPFLTSCQPYGGVTMDRAGNFFGVCTVSGGVGVFELTNCSQTCSLIDLHDFSYTDGYMPYGAPVLDADGNLYGTTLYGGKGGNCQLDCGVVWEITGVGAPRKD